MRSTVPVRVLPAALLLGLAAPASGQALQVPQRLEQTYVLFENVRVFDGRSESLSVPSQVLVVGNTIVRISTDPISMDRGAGVRVFEGGGRTLMPGLIDAHWHTLLARPTMADAVTGDMSYLNLLGGVEAEATLLRGFTTVRDLGGPSFSLKRAIDEGLILGPRIYPSGAMISITSGHGDFRQLTDVPREIGGPLARIELVGGAMIADTPDEVRIRTREQLMLGATQIKLTAGGGIASPHSPLDVTTFTVPELRAAVEAAENWGTYVTVHAYTPRAIQQAIEAGVKVIDHGHLADEANARLMAEKGIWWSLQPFLDDEDAAQFPEGSSNRQKQLEVMSGTDKAYRLAKRYNVKTAWGTDILFDGRLAAHQGRQLSKMVRWYTPAEVLKMATADNAELLALSGPRNPYPGKLGVVEEGALADLLLVDGDPLADITLIEDPARYFVVIMKDGKVFKNTLGASAVNTRQ